MKLIINSKDFESQFLRLLESYQEYYWLSAWASASSKAFHKLDDYQGRIKKVVVGLHFYQTHPDFIEQFINCHSVRYIKQPEGVFHPKMFLFYNSESDWELLVGSANFTQAAFTQNTEISTLITSEDNEPGLLLQDVFGVINTAWDESGCFTAKELEDYRKMWKNNRPKIDSLSGSYGRRDKAGKAKNKPLFKVPISTMEWSEFVQEVKQEKYHSLDDRLEVLSISRDFFEGVQNFNELTNNERKFIAGINNDSIEEYGVDCKYFGSMVGNGIFKNRIIENDIRISKALDEIPLYGQVIKEHYDRFITIFNSVFNGNYLGTSTRLLAMKRPDVFVCLDNKNKSGLCDAFGIKRSHLDYESYWNDIVMRMKDSNWWLHPNPQNDKERQISNCRAAFLDSLYYKE